MPNVTTYLDYQASLLLDEFLLYTDNESVSFLQIRIMRVRLIELLITMSLYYFAVFNANFENFIPKS
jgi:hypothetical protein